MMTTRTLLCSLAIGLLPLAVPVASAEAPDLSALAAEAAEGEAVIWYESSPAEHVAEVIAAFNQSYPDVEVRHVRVTGGTAIAARIIQESQAGTGTADVATSTAAQYVTLQDEDLLAEIDWAALGLDGAITPTATAAITTSPYFVLIWNKDKIADADAPDSWDALLDPQWKGRIGSWVLAGPFVQLAQPWGVEKARDYLEGFVAQEPILFQSTFPLAQQVAAGEVDLAIAAYHATIPPREAGAPIGMRVLDPTPIIALYSYVPKAAGNPAGARLLMAWLHGPEGAAAYEEITGRGNHLVEGTKTHAALAGTAVADFPPAEAARVAELSAEFNALLGSVGPAQ